LGKLGVFNDITGGPVGLSRAASPQSQGRQIPTIHFQPKEAKNPEVPEVPWASACHFNWNSPDNAVQVGFAAQVVS
jgi:hypothetical protein